MIATLCAEPQQLLEVLQYVVCLPRATGVSAVVVVPIARHLVLGGPVATTVCGGNSQDWASTLLKDHSLVKDH